MSLGIAFKGPEGIVLAADSRVTLNAEMQASNQKVLIPSFFDNATKLLKIDGQDFVGVVTYGAGAIGQNEARTAHSFVPEFETKLSRETTGRISVEEFADRLGKFFMEHWTKTMPQNYQGPDMYFLIGGYNDGEVYGRVFEVKIPSNPKPRELNSDPGPGQFGITWGGQPEIVERLLIGFNSGMLKIIKDQLNISDNQIQQLSAQLRGAQSAKIPYQFLPLQDCVDLSIFLVRTTIEMQKWSVGVRGVGGGIDVATITRTDGFKPIQVKSITGE